MSKISQCTNCDAYKTRYHYTVRMNRGEVPPICITCRHTQFRKLVCITCEEEKLGVNFTRMALTGETEPVCGTCRNKVKFPNRAVHLGDFFRSCLGCNRDFKTNNKFIRLCTGCKSNSKEFAVDWFGV